MINHHPSHDMLVSYVRSELPISVSVAVSIHAEMCETCQSKINELTAQEASEQFNQDVVNEEASSYEFELNASMELPDIDAIISEITRDETKALIEPAELKSISVGNVKVDIPRAISHISQGDWLNLGKLSRSRMDLNDGPNRSSLLFIDADGDVPHHTHNGFEITLLLSGSFSDEYGEYHRGDFMLLDGQHNHQPKTKDGCLCYTVVSDSLHFNQGLSRMLNPIGKLIY